jgi:L-fuculose-phosphate aldolase
VDSSQTAPHAALLEEIGGLCRDAWQKGLLAGNNGNISCRLHDRPGILCITRSGAAKGRLSPADFCLLEIDSGKLLYGSGPSMETGMHLALYRAVPGCAAILHTHPRFLLALSLRVPRENFLDLPLYEAAVWRKKLAYAPALPPGSEELALAVAAAAAKGAAVWMAGHGLCATGNNLAAALCLTEELEHLAAIQLLSLGSSATV